VGFAGTSILATQQSGLVMLTLNHVTGTYPGTVQVRVATVPSPGAGVNVAPVDQTVTFANGEGEKSVTIPIIPGAPNPGEVDVALALLPVAGPPDLVFGPPVILKIKASADLIAPTIIGSSSKGRSIELTFSKPMDPYKVQNIDNYYIQSTTTRSHDKKNALGYLFFGNWFGHGATSTTHRVTLRSATYDPLTKTVTLYPARPLGASVLTVMSSTQVKRPAGLNRRVQPPQVLADTMGNPIDGDTNHPGQFSVRVA
jgi:hypothetical protein